MPGIRNDHKKKFLEHMVPHLEIAPNEPHFPAFSHLWSHPTVNLGWFALTYRMQLN